MEVKSTRTREITGAICHQWRLPIRQGVAKPYPCTNAIYRVGFTAYVGTQTINQSTCTDFETGLLVNYKVKCQLVLAILVFREHTGAI